MKVENNAAPDRIAVPGMHFEGVDGITVTGATMVGFEQPLHVLGSTDVEIDTFLAFKNNDGQTRT